MKTTFLPSYVSLVAIGLIALQPAVLSAADRTWTGGAGTANWSDASNWSPSPYATGDQIFFVGSAPSLTTSNNLDNMRIGGIVFSSNAAAYLLTGNSGTLTGGVVNNSLNLQTIGISLILNGNREFNTAGGDILVTGTMTGVSGGTLTKTGAGTLTLQGANPFSGNTVTGPAVVVSSGTLVLDSESSATGAAVTGPLTISGGTLKLAGTGGNQIANPNNANGLVTVNSGVFDLNGRSESISGLAGSGGTITNTALATSSTLTMSQNQTTTYSGVLQDGGGVLALAQNNGKLTLTGANTHTGGVLLSNNAELAIGHVQALGAGNLRFTGNGKIRSASDTAYVVANNVDITNGDATFGSDVSGQTGNLTFGDLTKTGGNNIIVSNQQTTFEDLLGNGNINKQGLGILYFSGTASAGNVTVSAGSMVIDGVSTLNSATVATGASLVVNGNLTVGATTAGGFFGLGAANSAAATGMGAMSVTAGGVYGLNGTFTRALGAGASSFAWSANQSGGFAAFGGNLTVAFGGVLTPAALAFGTGQFVSSGQTLVLGDEEADGTVTLVNSIGFAGGVQTVRAEDGVADVDAVLSGTLSNGGLNKTGSGVLALTGNNTYGGGTTVTQGVLLVNNLEGSGVGTGAVVVSGAGAGIGGSGRIVLVGSAGITVNAGGVVAPGSSIESLEIDLGSTTGGFAMLGDSQFQFELGAGGVSISSVGISDLIILTGASAGDFAFSGNQIDFLGTGTAGWFKLFDSDLEAGTAWAGLGLTGQEIVSGLTVVNLTGGMSGTLYVGDGNGFGDYDDIYINVVPEPSTYALLAGGLTVLMIFARRRKATR